jgi:hypothetical protein
VNIYASLQNKDPAAETMVDLQLTRDYYALKGKQKDVNSFVGPLLKAFRRVVVEKSHVEADSKGRQEDRS